MWVWFPVAALVSLSKTLNHNCFVLRMGRKAVGPVCCVIHVKEPSTLIVKRRGLPRCFWLAPRNRQLDWWRFTNVDWIRLDYSLVQQKFYQSNILPAENIKKFSLKGWRTYSSATAMLYTRRAGHSAGTNLPTPGRRVGVIRSTLLPLQTYPLQVSMAIPRGWSSPDSLISTCSVASFASLMRLMEELV